MGLRKLVGGFLRGSLSTTDRRLKRPQQRSHLEMIRDSIESLESRLVLYAASGNAWPDAAMVTISFEPDGSDLGGVKSNLNQAFNSNSDLNGRWQAEILRAAQTWSQVTNINFVVVTDNGAASGSGKNQQGDTGFGDIRISGYDFGSSSLARAYMPPPINNYSVAGDIVFNTGVKFGVGKNYDLYTVAIHELGHALGLDHTSAGSNAEMWATYNGTKLKLSADDIAGIQSIYSSNAGRSADDYDAKASNGTFATATDITSEIAKTKSSAVIEDLDLTTNSDLDFYKVIAPKWVNGSMTLTVQSKGLSLLSPKLTVYAADQKTVIGTANALNQYGATVSVSVPNAVSGQTYYVKVEGADTSAFGVGSYGLIVDLGATTKPTIDSPKTTKANGKNVTSGGGVAEGSGEMDEILAPVPVIASISPDTGASSTDRTTSSNRIVLNGVGSIVSTVEVFQDGVSLGRTLNLLGTWSFTIPGTLSDGIYTFAAKGRDLLGQVLGTSDPFTVIIDTQAPDAPTLDVAGATAASNGPFTTSPTALTGQTEPSSLIAIYDNGMVIGTVTADGYGNWTYDLDDGLADGKHQLAVTSTDPAGNTSAPSSPQVVTVHTHITNPIVTGIDSDTGISSDDNITQSRNLILNGESEAGSLVTVFRDGVTIGTTFTGQNGLWTLDYTGVTLDDGVYSFTAKASDAVGHVSGLSSPLVVTVDNFVADSSVSYVTKTTTLLLLSTLNVQGQAGSNSSVQVFLNGNLLGTTTADGLGNWTYQYSPLLLLNGTYQFSSLVTDAAGNRAGATNAFNLVIGNTAPTVAGLSATNISSGTPTFSGTGTKGAEVDLYDGNTHLGTTLIGSTGKWSFTSPVLPKGRHSLVVVAKNSAGSGLPSSVLSIQV